MNTIMLSRFLGWFSLALGALEITMPRRFSRGLGLPGGPWLVRAFGLREIAAGSMVLANPNVPRGPLARVAGDALDLAVLLPALSPANRRREAAEIALAMVAGVTLLDILCSSALVMHEKTRAATAHRTRVTPQPPAGLPLLPPSP